MNETTAKTLLTNLSANQRMVGAIIIDSDESERCQVTGYVGTNPNYPDKWVVSVLNQYIIFSLDEVYDIKEDKIFLRLKGQRN